MRLICLGRLQFFRVILVTLQTKMNVSSTRHLKLDMIQSPQALHKPNFCWDDMNVDYLRCCA
jgi:hypothetical protein